MPSVTSLTLDKILEMVSGIGALELSNEELHAILATLGVEFQTIESRFDNFDTVTRPQLESQLAANAIALSDLNDNVLPNLELDLANAELSLTNLNTVDIPSLQAQLSSNSDWILEFDEITVPALNDAIALNTSALSDLNTVTLPGLSDRLSTLESGGGVDLSEIEGRLDALDGKFPVVGSDIAANTVTANNILADTITANEIASRTVTALEIVADTITANEIATNAITANEINAGAVTTAKIFAGAVTATEIATNAITAIKIDAGAITTEKVFAGAITANEIATGAITTNKIFAGAVTATEIATGAITTAKVFAGAITANEIATGAVTADKILAGAVTAVKISAGTIGVEKLAVGSVDNLVNDPTFASPGTRGVFWQAQPWNSIDPTGARNGGPALMVTNTAAQNFQYNLPLDVSKVEGGAAYRVSCSIKSSVAIAAGNSRIFVRFMTATGGTASIPVPCPAIAANTWSSFDGIVTAPSGSVSATVFVDTQPGHSTGFTWWDYVSMTRAMTGSLVVDGSIDGKTITGALIQTVSTASRGIKLTTTDLRAFDGSGNETAIISTTGNHSFIGEIGTAKPGEVGTFLYSTKFTRYGVQQVRPVIQMNVAATRDQPSIQAQSGEAGLQLYSGANTTAREARIIIDNGRILMGIESVADDATYAGAFLELSRQKIDIKAEAVTATAAGVVRADSTLSFIGYEFVDTAQGYRHIIGSPARIYGTNGLEVVSPNGGAWRKVAASAFDVSSDRAVKKNVAAPSSTALSLVRGAPSYEWEYNFDDEPQGRRRGPMAEDLPDMMVSTIESFGDEEHFAAGTKTVDLHQMISVLWQAVQEMDEELDQVPGLRKSTPIRKKLRLS